MAVGSRKAWSFVIDLKETLQQNRGMVFVRNLGQSSAFWFYTLHALNIFSYFCSGVYVCHIVEVSMWQHVNFSEEQSGSSAWCSFIQKHVQPSSNPCCWNRAENAWNIKEDHYQDHQTRDPDRMNRRIKDRNSNNE